MTSPPSNLDPQIPLTQQSLKSNPYQYDTHIQLIDLIENQLLQNDQMSDEDAQAIPIEHEWLYHLLKDSFHEFHAYYPLNEYLWQKYLSVIDKLATLSHLEKQLQKFNLLCEAVMEYFMIDLEVLRLEILTDLQAKTMPNTDIKEKNKHPHFDDGIQVKQALSELPSLKDAWLDCLTRCAGDYWSGTLLFTTFFSTDLFRDGDVFSEEEKRGIFRRAIVMPIKDVENLWKLYWDWEPKSDEREHTRATLLEKHLAKIDLVRRLNQHCAKHIEIYMGRKQENNPKIGKHFEKFFSMLKAEDNTFEPLYAIFRRATTICCLMDILWEKFIDYLWVEKSIYLVSACTNAVRNCSWNVELWIRKMAAFECQEFITADGQVIPPNQRTIKQFTSLKDRVEQTFVQAQTVGLASAEAYFKLFEWYCSFLREFYDTCTTEEQLIQVATVLRQTFNDCAQYLTEYFSLSPYGHRFQCLWANVEARKFGDFSQMRLIMDRLVEREPTNADFWIRYINLERDSGDSAMMKTLLERALIAFADGYNTLETVKSWAEESLLENGTLLDRVDWEYRIRERGIELKFERRQQEKEKKAAAKKMKKEEMDRPNTKNNEDSKKGKRKRDASPSSSRKRIKKEARSPQGKILKREPGVQREAQALQNPTIGPQIPHRHGNGQVTQEAHTNTNAATPKQIAIGPQLRPKTADIGPQLPSKVKKETIDQGASKIKKHRQRKKWDDNHELTIFTWKVPYSMKQRDVQQYFLDQGCNVKSTTLLRKEDKRSKGEAFVRMLDAESVQKALVLDGSVVRKMKIRVTKAQPKEDHEHQKQANVQLRSPKKISKKEKKVIPLEDEKHQHPIPRIALGALSGKEKESTAELQEQNAATAEQSKMLSNSDFKKFLM